MDKAHREADETARLYRWEDYTKTAKGFPYTLVCERTMIDLNLFAVDVWEKHGREGWYMPKIKAWNGLFWKQKNRKWQGWSFSLGRDIKLAKRHRNRLVVLHELTHAMGFWTHGRGFVRKYTGMIEYYTGIEPAWIDLSLGMFGIKR